MFVVIGYHWDTSDWVPVKEEGAVGRAPDGRDQPRGAGVGDSNYPPARLLVSLLTSGYIVTEMLMLQ